MKRLIFAAVLFSLTLEVAHAQIKYTKTEAMIEQAQPLTAEQQSIVAISALTAKGDLVKLKGPLNTGLDAGLTINEAKEVLIQLYAYCGFPRSLNGLNTLMAVIDDRMTRGIKDDVGRDASPIKDDGNRYDRGKRILESLTGQNETGPKTGYAAFSPEIERFLKEHLFADIFERDVLSYKDREIATISALASLGGVEPQLRSHLRIGLNVGLTVTQLEQLLSVIESNVGKPDADAGRRVLSEIAGSRPK